MNKAMFEDFIQGFFLAQITMFYIGLWSLLIGLICGILWVLGGMGWLGYNTWRRLGIPLVICPLIAISRHTWIPLISFPLMFGTFCLGYGIPSTQPPDEGSWLGRRFKKWARLVWWWILLLSCTPLFWR